MPTQLSGRVTIILAVLFSALWAIFPSAPKVLFVPFNHSIEWSFKPDLKPGIDMVGGTSLLYEIKVPPGVHTNDLAEQVMNSLKKRVDPDGIRNLIWRPQGNTRLEIQMPMNEKTKQTKALRAQFAAAQQELENTNLRVGEVLYDVQDLKGDERDAKLKGLAAGSSSRAELFNSLSTLSDQIDSAKGKNAAEEARLKIQFDKLIEQLNDSNLQVSELQAVLDLPKPEVREQKLAQLKSRFADFPKRLAAIDNFIKEYQTFSQVKGSIEDAAELKQLLRGSGVIEFHILANDLPANQVAEMKDRLQRHGPRVQAGDIVRWYELDRGRKVIDEVDQAAQELAVAGDDAERGQIAARLSEGNDRIKAMADSLITNLNDPAARERLKNQIVIAKLGVGNDLADYDGTKWALCYITPDKCLVTKEGQQAWHLQSASVQRDQNGALVIGFEFDPQGARYFGDLTGNNLQKPLGIVLDDKLISAPNINSQINGSGQITGGGRSGFSEQEATYIANTLNAGALPAQLAEEPISEQQIGPQLGEDNLRAGLYSSLLGLFVVAIFMLVYYHISGIVAFIALMMNMIIILGVMAALNATWTLPAVAGIVLTIGMSVDANVLVFERLREEQARGLSLKMALRNAYDRAASAIVDSNAVTAITCLILYWLGSEEVKGFGLTLLIGLVSSLFTALFVTKTIFAAMLKYGNLQKLGSLPITWPALGRALHPNINWMGLVKFFVLASSILVIVGGASVVGAFKRGELFDIEFVSGTAVQFELKQPAEIGEVRKWVTQAPESELPSPTVVSVGSDQKTYEVVTPSNQAKKVTDAVLKTLGDKLNILLASDFDDVKFPYDQVMNKAIFPIASDTKTVGGMAPATLRSHLGGVAIVLKNLTPKLTADDIKKRLEEVRLQPQVDASKSSQYRQFDVETSSDGSSAVVLTSDPNSPYDATDPIKLDQWTQDLVKPTWDMVRQAINNPPTMQKVSNFDAQVAGQMRNSALGALGLSVLVIMGYIWLRFGNLKYGFATVVAMLHDTLLVIGFIGLSHFLGHGIGRSMFLIEPFRVNLTLVAAVLTIMSYSMVDTIVVFDRIRENRGKFGHLDGQIINDSVNQTLSRTLLTVFTTLLTVFVMYVFGGPGIHGFTFVMLVGILIGTYSSFAIAAPILLLGEKPARPSGPGKSASRKQLQGA